MEHHGEAKLVVELALVRSAYLSLASLQAYMADSSDDEE
jgi:hypothetical protein